MINQIFDHFIPLFFLGAMTFFGLAFHLIIRSINSYYKTNGKLIKAKIIAFKEETKTRRYRGGRETSTTIRPVIEYYQNGDRRLFLGSNQNYLNHHIGKEVDIYLVEDKENHVLQKENVYRIFNYVSLIFVITPLVIIFFNNAPIVYKLTIPLTSLLIFIPIILKMRATKAKLDDSRSLLTVVQEKLIENNSMIDIKEFDNSNDYIKASKDFNKKLSSANLIGIIMTAIFGGGLYFLTKHVYQNRISKENKTLIDKFLNDANEYGPIFEQIGKNEDITILAIFIAFSVILVIGFSINLNGFLKR
ncbi:hypothetical protein [Halobacteriovorax sp.]|uniref:hypothetical protein n=1 Tax=Halobacteriovorax sp. TaxID=2020862 RepID=UPI003AF22B5D